MKMKRSMRYIAVVTVIMAFLSGCSSRESIKCERVDASVPFEKAFRGEFKPLKAVGYVYSGSGKDSLFDGNKMIVCQILENGRVIVSIDGNRSMRRMNTMAQMGLGQAVEMTASDEIQQLKRMAYVFLEEGIDTDEIESGDPLPDGVYVYAGLEEMTAVDGEALKLRKFIALSGKDKEKAMRNYVEACRKAEAERQAAKEAAEEAERQQVLEERRRRQTELEMAQKKNAEAAERLLSKLDLDVCSKIKLHSSLRNVGASIEVAPTSERYWNVKKMQEAHDWLGMINAMSWSYDGSKRRDFPSENDLRDIISKFGIMRVNVSICWNSDVNVKDRDYTCVCLAKDDVMGGMEVECRPEMESGSNCLKLSIEFRTDACYVVQYNSYQRMCNQTGNSLYHLSTAVSTSKNPVQASQVWRTEFEKILNSALEQ